MPRQSVDEEEEDPRANLVKRLQEYERFKNAALEIDELNREFRDFWSGRAAYLEVSAPSRQPEVSLKDLVLGFVEVVSRAELKSNHPVQLEVLSTRDRMIKILRTLESGPKVLLSLVLFLVLKKEKRSGCYFYGHSRTYKEGLLETVQGDQFAPIYIKLA